MSSTIEDRLSGVLQWNSGSIAAKQKIQEVTESSKFDGYLFLCFSCVAVNNSSCQFAEPESLLKLALLTP